ncbi:ATP-binding cassette domain-containing protein [Paenibacillus aurantius]|uniref:ATP-binding cassette domain-containing protein n=1 Tax=Paenibacillus aurantius TaxID=2918900 RepID=A0AA96RIC0_9BACL|nr:ATP-binding cassette domain-containing protein [Paenibacillus aurantius]WNQ14263.1 ATP-binding cassette domain-containing protein [Paenibacillus aurantius]
MIKLTDIYFKREERTIIKGINLQVKPAEQWVILGRNGSGKTTLLEMINGYLFPSSGKVEVMGNLYGTVDLREVRKKIGYISQSLFEKLNLGDPVWEVVATGEYGFLRFYQTIPQEVIDKAEEMLNFVGLSHVAKQPLGTLSQGERKKVMLARSLMTEPSILILDEPCAGLDLYEREKLLENIDQLAGRGITTIYVTHHVEEIMPLYTHVVLIDQGETVASGPKKEVLTAENLGRAFGITLSLEWNRERPWIKVLDNHF